MTISFTPMTQEHISLWQQWAKKEHVKKVWFIEGYETTDYIYQKIAGNGYDYPFIIFLDTKPIGYIVSCDLYAYRNLCKNPKGLFTNEAPGTFCMDLFIGEEDYLDQGHGANIVRSFVEYIFHHFKAKIILIDPAIVNKRAIRCYEKAGFKFMKEAFDGVTNCYVMQMNNSSNIEELTHMTLKDSINHSTYNISDNYLGKILSNENKFVKNIIATYGESGQKWLDNLPTLLSLFATCWNLIIENGFENLSFHYVAQATTRDGVKVVLKCGVPNPEFMTETAALTHFNGIGSVKLIQFDEKAGVMLLDRIIPGTSLEEYSDNIQAMNIAINLMEKLHKPIQDTTSFPTLAQWFTGFEKLYQRFNGGTGPFSASLVDRAHHISQELLSSINKPVLLHGDLHYGNILFSEKHNDWFSIDPKGVIGEQEYEIPLPILSSVINKNILANQMRRFIDRTGFDQAKVLGWLFAKIVLAAWWSFEDTGQIEKKFIACAEAVQTIKFK